VSLSWCGASVGGKEKVMKKQRRGKKKELTEKVHPCSQSGI
jgi:hypothetical protein